MVRRESRVARIVRLTSKRFPSLSTSGTGVEELVRFILAKRSVLEKAQQKNIGDEGRDILYTSELLEPIPRKDLGVIPYLRQREVREQLRSKAYPFSRLNKEAREKLLHLPISWIREGAELLLNARRLKRATQVRVLAD